MTDLKKLLQNKGQCKDKSISQNSFIFLNNDTCETPYIDILVDLLAITFI